MANLKQHFTHLYPISKTLRFELKPVGDTQKNIKKDEILENDNNKADSYQKLKPIIDDFHRDFIEKSLNGLSLDWQELANKIQDIKKIKLNRGDKDYQKQLKDKQNLEKELQTLQGKYRKDIISYLSKNAEYKLTDITKADLIKKILPEWLQDKNEKELLKEFKSFDGYFTGFHENRKNIYTDKEQTTALPYRIVNDNFVKFNSNLQIYTKNLAKYNIFADEFINTLQLDENIKKFDLLKNKNIKEIITELQNIFKGGINYFNNTATQNGIKKYNEYIHFYNLINNLYKQKNNLKNKDLPNLTELFKQILAQSEKGNYIEKLENDNQVIELIDNYQTNIKEKEIIKNLTRLLTNNQDYDLDKIYLKSDSITKISKAIFDDWSFMGNTLNERYTQTTSPKETKKYEEDKKKFLKQDFSLAFLQNCIDGYCENNNQETKNIVKYFIDELSKISIDDQDYQNIKNKYQNTEKNLIKDSAEKDVKIIKDLLDNYNQILWIIKPLILKNKLEKDENFYTELEKNYFELLQITGIYNLVRNYITQKPYSKEKIKLNFENPTLADGWDINKEKDNTSIILKKNGLYYLAIMHSKHKKVFDTAPKTSKNNNYQKLNYKQVADAARDIHCLINIEGKTKRFTKGLAEKRKQYCPDIYNIKSKETYKGKGLIKKDLTTFIDYYKICSKQYWDWCKFDFLDSNKYNNLKEFTDDINTQGYKIWFSDIDENYIDDLVKDGKIYLFQLYNKDFSKYSKGAKNLHTLYWQELFSPENIKNTIYKLNGEAELFYRPASINYDKNIWNKGHHANDKNKKQNYPIIKDKRFALDKYFFHVPITINFKAKQSFNFNQKVKDFLKNNPDVNIIGIDRGEKNLAYYSVINQQGGILDQDSFNTVNGVDYHKLLEKAEKQRDEARKNWKTINKIKDLKSGYISQVVHKITKLMVEHNAIVVMEDLNMGMKRGRQKIEKQVYQNFEKALIEKLNYLSFKDYENDEVGSIKYGLQLSAPFESFAKMGKQTGFLFYVEPSYTSKIDFTTGFVPLKYFKYESVKSAENLMNAIEKIIHQDNAFIVDIDYSKISKVSGKAKWHIYLDKEERYNYAKNSNGNFESQKINVYAELKQCFADNNIDLENIKKSIINTKSKKVYSTLFKYLNLVSQMRFNSEDEDYILSPIKNNKDEFFRTNLNSAIIPKDSDANGAYHIALKGLYTLHNKINKDEKDLYITRAEWFEYAQEMAAKK
jgi:hypothetical protein